jgi:hypothetical protein
MEPIIPIFFCVGVLVWLGLREVRKWAELFANIARSEHDDDSPEPEMSESVKHMYN